MESTPLCRFVPGEIKTLKLSEIQIAPGTSKTRGSHLLIVPRLLPLERIQCSRKLTWGRPIEVADFLQDLLDEEQKLILASRPFDVRGALLGTTLCMKEPLENVEFGDHVLP